MLPDSIPDAPKAAHPDVPEAVPCCVKNLQTIKKDSTLQDSAIRNNNLGYAYANELYVVPNLEIAEL